MPRRADDHSGRSTSVFPGAWRDLLGPALMVAAAASVVATPAVAGVPHQTHPSPPSWAADAAPDGDVQTAHVGDGDFCPGQVSFATLDRLVAASPTSIWMPDAEAASRSELEATATCSGTPTLVFASGVSIAGEPGWHLDDPEQHWTDTATQWGGDLRTILDRPAYVFDLDDTSDDPSVEPVPGATPTSEVLLVLDGTLVRLLGPNLPADELVEVAASLDPETPIRARRE